MRDRPTDRQGNHTAEPLPLPPLHPNIQILICPIPLVPDVEPGRVDDPPPPSSPAKASYLMFRLGEWMISPSQFHTLWFATRPSLVGVCLDVWGSGSLSSSPLGTEKLHSLTRNTLMKGRSNCQKQQYLHLINPIHVSPDSVGGVSF